MANPNEAAAQGLQEKLELYLLGLVFTLLGLSIQTAKFDGPSPQRIAELLGWALLLISGLVGIRRLQWVPALLRYGAAKQRSENEVFQVQDAPAEAPIECADGTVSVGEFIANRAKNIADVEAIMEPLEAKITSMGKVQTWSFVAGVCAIAVARAYMPVSGIVAVWYR